MTQLQESQAPLHVAPQTHVSPQAQCYHESVLRACVSHAGDPMLSGGVSQVDARKPAGDIGRCEAGVLYIGLAGLKHILGKGSSFRGCQGLNGQHAASHAAAPALAQQGPMSSIRGPRVAAMQIMRPAALDFEWETSSQGSDATVPFVPRITGRGHCVIR